MKQCGPVEITELSRDCRMVKEPGPHLKNGAAAIKLVRSLKLRPKSSVSPKG
jgi:hypothetical protein